VQFGATIEGWQSGNFPHWSEVEPGRSTIADQKQSWAKYSGDAWESILNEMNFLLSKRTTEVR
jgi:hypothetical protein